MMSLFSFFKVATVIVALAIYPGIVGAADVVVKHAEGADVQLCASPIIGDAADVSAYLKAPV